MPGHQCSQALRGEHLRLNGTGGWIGPQSGVYVVKECLIVVAAIWALRVAECTAVWARRKMTELVHR